MNKQAWQGETLWEKQSLERNDELSLHVHEFMEHISEHIIFLTKNFLLKEFSLVIFYFI